MRISVSRYALSICVGVAFLADCGGLHPPVILNGSALETRDPDGKMPATSVSFSLLHSFGGKRDGNEPTSGLTYVDGTFYGTTEVGGDPCYGGRTGCGTVFTITAEGREQVLYRFRPPRPVVPDNSGVIHLRDSLYGVTERGGSGNCGYGMGCGTVFEMSTSGKERTLYSFKGHSDGEEPVASLRYVGGKLYGTTVAGGAHIDGTVFEVELSGKERVLHAFSGGRDGSGPSAALTNVNGALYGTTPVGGGAHWCAPNIGTDGCGIVFAVTRSGTERVIYRFKGDFDGASPEDALVNVNGLLYGTTYFGGLSTYCPGGCGTVFEVNPSSGRERIIYSFKGGTDGFQPVGGLLEYHGALYGTTAFGGTGEGPCSISGYGHCGTIYRVSTSGVESVLHSFQGWDGNRPWTGRLIQVNGKLYGTTPLGGSHCQRSLGCGTVFVLTP
jgi:uncharacterized repeat protein (TIGR03803 family)